MGLSLLESFRKLIRQDTVRIGGTVGNIHGAVRVDLGDVSEVNTQTWLALRINSATMPTLTSFFDTFAEQSSTMSLEAADNGVLTLTTKANTVLLLRTVVTAERALNFNLDITIPGTGASAMVFVDGNLLRSVSGSVAVPVSVPAGKHSLYVMVLAPSVTIAVPPRIQLTGETDIPRAPQWTSVDTGYLDEAAGTAKVTLRWISDPEAGGYRVYRRDPVMLADLLKEGDGLVTSVSDLAQDGTFSLSISGNQGPKIEVGKMLISNGQAFGIVTRFAVVQTAMDNPATTLVDESAYETTVFCRLPMELDSVPNVLGQIVFIGSFNEIARVSRVVNASVVEYIDASVSKDRGYDYVLRATGLVDETVLSPMSSVRYVVAGDNTPPGPITFLEGYPLGINKQVTVKFMTPMDLDYAGVNVYHRYEINNMTPEGPAPYNYASLSGDGLTVTADNSEFPVEVDNNLVGYFLQFDLPDFPSYTFTIDSNTASTLTLTEAVPLDIRTALTAATGSVGLLIFKDLQVITDAGLPNRQDELQFFADNYGKYFFCSFDRAGNEQAIADAVSWDYSSTNDFMSQPPVVGLRQLLPDEQDYFSTTLQTTTTSGSAIVTVPSTTGLIVGMNVSGNSRIPETATITSIPSATTVQLSVLATASGTGATTFGLYNDRVKYAILELWAYNPGPNGTKSFEGVTIYYQRDVQDAEPIALTPIPHQDRPFPDMVKTETVTATVTTASGSTTATLASTADLRIGMAITGSTRIPAGATVTAIVNATTFTLSANATGTGTSTPTFTITAQQKAVLDDPQGVRSRFVLLNREYSVIRFWAENADGLSSDITTYIADTDTTPEVAVESYINPLNDTARFVAVVDDDTNGFSWQVDNGPVTAVDTRTIKRYESQNIPLKLGEKKILRVVPYAIYNPGPPVTLEGPGEAVVLELIRTPKSTVVFDNKDSQGNRSSVDVTATFSMAPAPIALVSNRSCSIAESGTEFVLTDSTPATTNWTTNQYRSAATAYYYIRLRPAGLPAMVRRITANTASTLKVSGLPKNYNGLNSVPYDIIDGAVLWRIVSGAVGDFLPTSGKETFARKTESFDIEFYATKNDCYPENVNRVTVDSDTLASIAGLAYNQITAGDDKFWEIGFASYDDDATFWECYEKKGGYPVKAGVTVDAAFLAKPIQMTDIDRTYMRFTGTIDQTSYRRSAAGMTPGDVWYAIAVPKNSFGQPGYPAAATSVVGAIDLPRIFDLTLTPVVGTSTVSVNWTNGSAVLSSNPITIEAIRSDSPESPRILTSTAGAKPYSLNIGETIVASGGTTRSWKVSVDLDVAGGNYQTRYTTFNVQTGGGGGGGGGSLTFTASASTYDPGNCDANNCSSFYTRPHTRRVSWTLTVTGQTIDFTSPYLVNVEGVRSTVQTGSPAYAPLAMGLPVAQRAYEDGSYCLYADFSGATSYWYYRVTLTDLNGVQLVSPITIPVVTAQVKNCTSDGRDAEPF